MGFSVSVGTFALPASTNSNYEAVNSLSFQPSFVWFYPTHRTAVGQDTSNAWFGWGAMNASAVACCHGITNGTGRTDDTVSSCLLITNTSGTVLASAAAASTRFDSNGFHLNVTKGDSNQYLVAYIALGGTDLSNSWVGNFAFRTSAEGVGTKEITAPGFQPNLLNAFSGEGGAPSTYPANYTTWWGWLSFATGTTSTGGDSHATSTYGNVAAPTTCFQTQKTGAASGTAHLYVSHDTSVYDEGHLEKWTTNGFEEHCTTISGDYGSSGAALAGLQVKVGTVSTPTSTGSQATTGVGFQPSLLLLFGWEQASSDSISSEPAMFVGAGTSSSSRWVCNWSVIYTNKNCYYSRVSTSGIVQVEDSTATSGNPPDLLVADLTSLDSDGFTLNWTTVAGTNRQILYLAIGPAASSGVTGTLTSTLSAVTATSATTVIVAGTASPTLSAVTTTSGTTVIVAGTATPTLSAVTSTSAVTVIVTATATPTLDAVTASGTAVVETPGVTGTATPTLDAIVPILAGVAIVTGTATPTLDTITTTSATGIIIDGASSPTLADIIATSAVSLTITCTLSTNLVDLTLSGTATVAEAGVATGNLTKDLDAVTVNGVGDVDLVAEAIKTLDAVIASADADLLVAGSTTPTLDAVGLNAAALAIASGVATPTLGNATLSATATVGIAATATPVLDSVTPTTDTAIDIDGDLNTALSTVIITAYGTNGVPALRGVTKMNSVFKAKAYGFTSFTTTSATHTQLTAASLIPFGDANLKCEEIMVTVETAAIRFRIDGTSATSSVGHIIWGDSTGAAANDFIIQGYDNIRKLSIIAVNTAAPVVITLGYK